MRQRCFLALPLASAFESTFKEIIEKLRPGIDAIKWVRPEQVHLTLHFFGSITEEEVDQVRGIIPSVLKNSGPLNLGLNGLGFFPNPKTVRVIWMALTGDIEPLKALQGQIATALMQHSFPLENRPFKAHATIGRVHKGKAVRHLDLENRISSALQSPPEAFDRLILYKSSLTPAGPLYEPLETFPLSSS